MSILVTGGTGFIGAEIVRDLLARRLGRKSLTKNMLVTTDPEGGTMRGIV